MKTHLLAALLLVCGGAAMAQAQPAPYAKIVEVDGLVTVTTNNQLSNAVKDMPLVRGGQVLTTGSGTATVEFADGCKVSLQPGQSLLIEGTACRAFLAAAPAAAPASLFTPTTVLLGVGSLALLAAATGGNANAATPATPAVPGGPGVPATPAIPATPAAPVSGS